MKKTKISLIILEASEGMVLTNGVVYSKTPIHLACNDSEENYHEITDAEFAEIVAKEEV